MLFYKFSNTIRLITSSAYLVWWVDTFV